MQGKNGSEIKHQRPHIPNKYNESSKELMPLNNNSYSCNPLDLIFNNQTSFVAFKDETKCNDVGTEVPFDGTKDRLNLCEPMDLGTDEEDINMDPVLLKSQDLKNYKIPKRIVQSEPKKKSKFSSIDKKHVRDHRETQFKNHMSKKRVRASSSNLYNCSQSQDKPDQKDINKSRTNDKNFARGNHSIKNYHKDRFLQTLKDCKQISRQFTEKNQQIKNDVKPSNSKKTEQNGQTKCQTNERYTRQFKKNIVSKEKINYPEHSSTMTDKNSNKTNEAAKDVEIKSKSCIKSALTEKMIDKDKTKEGVKDVEIKSKSCMKSAFKKKIEKIIDKDKPNNGEKDVEIKSKNCTKSALKDVRKDQLSAKARLKDECLKVIKLSRLKENRLEDSKQGTSAKIDTKTVIVNKNPKEIEDAACMTKKCEIKLSDILWKPLNVKLDKPATKKRTQSIDLESPSQLKIKKRRKTVSLVDNNFLKDEELLSPLFIERSATISFIYDDFSTADEFKAAYDFKKAKTTVVIDETDEKATILKQNFLIVPPFIDLTENVDTNLFNLIESKNQVEQIDQIQIEEKYSTQIINAISTPNVNIMKEIKKEVPVLIDLSDIKSEDVSDTISSNEIKNSENRVVNTLINNKLTKDDLALEQNRNISNNEKIAPLSTKSSIDIPYKEHAESKNFLTEPPALETITSMKNKETNYIRVLGINELTPNNSPSSIQENQEPVKLENQTFETTLSSCNFNNHIEYISFEKFTDEAYRIILSSLMVFTQFRSAKRYYELAQECPDATQHLNFVNEQEKAHNKSLQLYFANRLADQVHCLEELVNFDSAKFVDNILVLICNHKRYSGKVNFYNVMNLLILYVKLTEERYETNVVTKTFREHFVQLEQRYTQWQLGKVNLNIDQLKQQIQWYLLNNKMLKSMLEIQKKSLERSHPISTNNNYSSYESCMKSAPNTLKNTTPNSMKNTAPNTIKNAKEKSRHANLNQNTLANANKTIPSSIRQNIPRQYKSSNNVQHQNQVPIIQQLNNQNLIRANSESPMNKIHKQISKLSSASITASCKQNCCQPYVSNGSKNMTNFQTQKNVPNVTVVPYSIPSPVQKKMPNISDPFNLQNGTNLRLQNIRTDRSFSPQNTNFVHTTGTYFLQKTPQQSVQNSASYAPQRQEVMPSYVLQNVTRVEPTNLSPFSYNVRTTESNNKQDVNQKNSSINISNVSSPCLLTESLKKNLTLKSLLTTSPSVRSMPLLEPEDLNEDNQRTNGSLTFPEIVQEATGISNNSDLGNLPINKHKELVRVAGIENNPVTGEKIIEISIPPVNTPNHIDCDNSSKTIDLTESEKSWEIINISDDESVINLNMFPDIPYEEFRNGPSSIKKEVPNSVKLEPDQSLVKIEEVSNNCNDLKKNDQLTYDALGVKTLEMINILPNCICGQSASKICVCKTVMYCCEKCQRDDWPKHIKKCIYVI